ncbi:MAG: hypothetical protein Q8S18_03590 [Bacteroidales bacterium]|nr:hypothetical protein [Bacteroidales bacterium]
MTRPKRLATYLSIVLIALNALSCNTTGINKSVENSASEKIEVSGFYSGSYVMSEMASAHSDLELFADSTFLLLRRINNDTIWTGILGIWTIRNGNQLQLGAGRDMQLYLKIMQGQLLILNSEGEMIDKEQQFVLKNIPDSSAFDRLFISQAEYFYMADAAIMRFCGDGKTWPVAVGGDNLNAERLFLKENAFNPNEKVFIEALMSITSTENMEGNIKPHIFIDQLMGRSWMTGCVGDE